MKKMPIHKTDGKWQWGGHGKKYSSRKGAEKQAAAAYANGYTGKSLADKINLFLSKETVHEENRRVADDAAKNLYRRHGDMPKPMAPDSINAMKRVFAKTPKLEKESPKDMAKKTKIRITPPKVESPKPKTVRRGSLAPKMIDRGKNTLPFAQFSLADKIHNFVIKQLILKAQPMDKESAFAIATAMCQKLGYNDFSEGSIGREKRKEIANAIMRDTMPPSQSESLPYNQGTYGVSTGVGVRP